MWKLSFKQLWLERTVCIISSYCDTVLCGWYLLSWVSGVREGLQAWLNVSWKVLRGLTFPDNIIIVHRQLSPSFNSGTISTIQHKQAVIGLNVPNLPPVHNMYRSQIDASIYVYLWKTYVYLWIKTHSNTHMHNHPATHTLLPLLKHLCADISPLNALLTSLLKKPRPLQNIMLLFTHGAKRKSEVRASGLWLCKNVWEKQGSWFKTYTFILRSPSLLFLLLFFPHYHWAGWVQLNDSPHLTFTVIHNCLYSTVAPWHTILNNQNSSHFRQPLVQNTLKLS